MKIHIKNVAEEQTIETTIEEKKIRQRLSNYDVEITELEDCDAVLLIGNYRTKTAKETIEKALLLKKKIIYNFPMFIKRPKVGDIIKTYKEGKYGRVVRNRLELKSVIKDRYRLRELVDLEEVENPEKIDFRFENAKYKYVK